MDFTTEIGTDISRAAQLLRAGGVVGIPTETVYGLAANALDEAAVVKIFEAKDRPFFDPLIVHVKDAAAIGPLVQNIPVAFQRLIAHFTPGPLTLLFPKNKSVPDITTSGLMQVGIRVPAHPMLRKLLNEVDFPLAAPSANPFGYISPTNAKHVFDQLQGKIPYILDGGESEVGVESTIVGMEENRLVVYRLGGVSLEAIESVAGKVELLLNGNSNPLAPGQLASHYAPRKPMVTGDVALLLNQFPGKKIAVISFSKIYNERTAALSAKEDLNEAARNLFRVMREIDNGDADMLLAEIFPEEGLGKAINDRLKRAAIN